jgi:endonuclease YncB( thermonuclease family)
MNIAAAAAAASSDLAIDNVLAAAASSDASSPRLVSQLQCCSKQSVEFFRVDPTRVYAAKIVDVYDGDTMTAAFDHLQHVDSSSRKRKRSDSAYCLHKWRIRLSGVDTAELKTGNRKQRAREVRDHVRSLVLGKIVQLQPIEFEKYGRLLCRVKFLANAPLPLTAAAATTTTATDAASMSRQYIDLSDYLVQCGMAVAYTGGTKSTTTAASDKSIA